MDSDTGALSTRKSLDFEKNQIFTLLVQVHDLDGNETFGEPFQDNAVVYVSVKVSCVVVIISHEDGFEEDVVYV